MNIKKIGMFTLGAALKVNIPKKIIRVSRERDGTKRGIIEEKIKKKSGL